MAGFGGLRFRGGKWRAAVQAWTAEDLSTYRAEIHNAGQFFVGKSVSPDSVVIEIAQATEPLAVHHNMLACRRQSRAVMPGFIDFQSFHDCAFIKS